MGPRQEQQEFQEIKHAKGRWILHGFSINARLPDNEAHVPGVKRSHSKR